MIFLFYDIFSIFILLYDILFLFYDILRRKVLPSTKVSYFKVKKSDKFHLKTARNTSRSLLMQGLDTNIHCLAVQLSGWIPIFVKPFKVILSKRFVIIKQSQTFKRKYDEEQLKYKTISSLGC